MPPHINSIYKLPSLLTLQGAEGIESVHNPVLCTQIARHISSLSEQEGGPWKPKADVLLLPSSLP